MWEETQSTRQPLWLTWANIFSGRGGFLYTTSPSPSQSKSARSIKRPTCECCNLTASHESARRNDKLSDKSIPLFYLSIQRALINATWRKRREARMHREWALDSLEAYSIINFNILRFSFCVTNDNVYYNSYVLFPSDDFILSIFIPQNRYDMCRRRKGGRCTKGTAGMVYYIAITLYSFFFFLIFVTYIWYSIFASLYIVGGIDDTRNNGT